MVLQLAPLLPNADTVRMAGKAKSDRMHTCTNCGWREPIRMSALAAGQLAGKFTGGMAKRTYVVHQCEYCKKWFPASLLRLHKPRCEDRPGTQKTKPINPKLDKDYERRLKKFEYLKKIGGSIIKEFKDNS